MWRNLGWSCLYVNGTGGQALGCGGEGGNGFTAQGGKGAGSKVSGIGTNTDIRSVGGDGGFGEKGNGGSGGPAKTIGNSSGLSEVIRATGGNGGDADRAISPDIYGGIGGKAIHIPNTASSLAKISYRGRNGTPEKIPNDPSNLTATIFSNTQINLSWTDNSENEIGFKVEQSIDFSSFRYVASVTAKSYSDTDLVPGIYQYRIYAYNLTKKSGYSNSTLTPLTGVAIKRNSDTYAEYGEPDNNFSAATIYWKIVIPQGLTITNVVLNTTGPSVKNPMGPGIISQNAGENKILWYQFPAAVGFNTLPLDPGTYNIQINVTLSNSNVMNSNIHNILVLRADLKIYNGGGDLDNGELAGSQGDAVLDDSERSEGAYLLLNWDDDNSTSILNDDGTWAQLPKPDIEETSVQNEDNLAKLVPSLNPMLTTGIIEFEVIGNDKIRFWNSMNKGTEIIFAGSKKTWDLSNIEQKTEFINLSQNGLWIEGVKQSGKEKDIEFFIRFKTSSVLTLSQDHVKATVVMINLGNVVYRDNIFWLTAPRGHSAIVYAFTVPCNKTNLLNDSNLSIIEVQKGNEDGVVGTNSLYTVTKLAGSPAKGCFTNMLNPPTFLQRLRIIKTAVKLIHKRQTDYPDFAANALEPVNWDGQLNTIVSLRCDGLIEVCYEMNGVSIWAMRRDPPLLPPTYNYNISEISDVFGYDAILGEWSLSPNGLPDNLEEHNDTDLVGWFDTFQPATQAGYVTLEDATTNFGKQNLCIPTGTKGGN